MKAQHFIFSAVLTLIATVASAETLIINQTSRSIWGGGYFQAESLEIKPETGRCYKHVIQTPQWNPSRVEELTTALDPQSIQCRFLKASQEIEVRVGTCPKDPIVSQKWSSDRLDWTKSNTLNWSIFGPVRFNAFSNILSESTIRGTSCSCLRGTLTLAPRQEHNNIEAMTGRECASYFDSKEHKQMVIEIYKRYDLPL